MDFSKSLDKIGVREMGLKSGQVVGRASLATGVMELHFHWDGTKDSWTDRLKRIDIGLAKDGAESLRNQDGKASRPGDVGFNSSNILKTKFSEKIGLGLVLTVCFLAGSI